jgi:hypothetical protein
VVAAVVCGGGGEGGVQGLAVGAVLVGLLQEEQQAEELGAQARGRGRGRGEQAQGGGGEEGAGRGRGEP